MFLDVHYLEVHKIEFEETISPGRVDFGGDVTQVEDLAASGVAEALASEIHLQGSFRTAVEVTCDRCLEPVRRDLEAGFDLYYRPMAEIAHEEIVAIRPEDLGIGFYEGSGLLLEDALKEQVLLALPMKNVCHPDCRGLCPRCGRNRNREPCGCQPPARDLRWAPLDKLRP